MRAEIFVVLTEIDKSNNLMQKLQSLEAIKREIIRLYGGLTETGVEKGYFDMGKEICVDSVKRWIVYIPECAKDDREICNCQNDDRLDITTQINHKFLSFHVSQWRTLEQILNRLKITTKQQCQAFGIDGILYLV